jgi:hypothetical protein
MRLPIHTEVFYTCKSQHIVVLGLQRMPQNVFRSGQFDSITLHSIVDLRRTFLVASYSDATTPAGQASNCFHTASSTRFAPPVGTPHFGLHPRVIFTSCYLPRPLPAAHQQLCHRTHAPCAPHSHQSMEPKYLVNHSTL